MNIRNTLFVGFGILIPIFSMWASVIQTTEKFRPIVETQCGDDYSCVVNLLNDGFAGPTIILTAMLLAFALYLVLVSVYELTKPKVQEQESQDS